VGDAYDAVLALAPSCGHWCAGAVVLGVVDVDGVVLVEGVVVVCVVVAVGVAALLLIAATAAPPPAARAPPTPSASKTILAEIRGLLSCGYRQSKQWPLRQA
jgi:hypothetical protein